MYCALQRIRWRGCERGDCARSSREHSGALLHVDRRQNERVGTSPTHRFCVGSRPRASGDEASRIAARRADDAAGRLVYSLQGKRPELLVAPAPRQAVVGMGLHHASQAQRRPSSILLFAQQHIAQLLETFSVKTVTHRTHIVSRDAVAGCFFRQRNFVGLG